MDSKWKWKIYKFLKEWKEKFQKLTYPKIQKGIFKVILIFRDKKYDTVQNTSSKDDKSI